MMKMKELCLAAALTVALMPTARADDAAQPLPRAELEQLIDAYTLVRAQYVDAVDGKKLITDAIGGMVAALDPHSQYLNKDDLIELEKASSGEYVGIGVDVQIERGKMLVMSVSEGGPAERAGIRAGDNVVAIDGAGITGLAVGEINKRMRGLPGSVIKLELSRKGAEALRAASVTREALHGKTVEARRLERGLVWVRISEFGATTATELAEALASFGERKPVALILDLRNDPGGLVSAAVGVAAAFLPPDALVFEARGRVPGVNVKVTASPRYYALSEQAAASAKAPAWAQDVPMAVLINGASVSAAELLAAALQDHKRGVLVGTRTFGKGSIQGVVPLSDDSAVKMTVARYYTPAGREIQARGVSPDIVVEPAAAATRAQSLLLREADLDNYLRPATEGGLEDASAVNHATGENAASFGTRDDQALAAAVRLLAPDASGARTAALSLAKLVQRWQTRLRDSFKGAAGY